jgi:hypothetical protein
MGTREAQERAIVYSCLDTPYNSESCERVFGVQISEQGGDGSKKKFISRSVRGFCWFTWTAKQIDRMDQDAMEREYQSLSLSKLRHDMTCKCKRCPFSFIIHSVDLGESGIKTTRRNKTNTTTINMYSLASTTRAPTYTHTHTHPCTVYSAICPLLNHHHPNRGC